MRVDANGTDIEVEVTGEGRPVVLLHGFPDTGRLWRHQVPALAGAGFQVITPDLRGYGGSDKPTDTASYAIPFLAADVLAVLDHLGVDRAHVVGHDWGAALAWALASFAPERVDHLVVLSVGHPAAFGAAGMRQWQLSWYILLFQFEGIAEQWLTADGWTNFREWCDHPDADAVIARARAQRIPHAGAVVLPRERAARGVGDAVAGADAVGAVTDDGRVELERLRAHRGADDGVGRARRGAVALRATRRTRALDAARGA